MASSKADRRAAEPAAEWYAREVLGCIHTVRAIRTKFQRQDLFGADVIGKRSNGSWVAIQVTAAENESSIRSRRRKLDRLPWSSEDTVLMLQLVSLPHPANKSRKQKWFRIHRFDPVRLVWTTEREAHLIEPLWLQKTWASAHKED